MFIRVIGDFESGCKSKKLEMQDVAVGMGVGQIVLASI